MFKNLLFILAGLGCSFSSFSQVAGDDWTSIPDSFDIVSTVKLESDGPGGTETYSLIRSKYGPDCIEAPDLYANNHPGFKHIQEDSDTVVGNYFAFYIHRDIDWDRDKYPDISDRQRNEIKGYAGSVATLKGSYGEYMYLKWKFRVNDSMTISKNFCHFFQLKGVDGDDANPIITLSASLSGSTQEFKIIHSATTSYEKLKIYNNYPDIRGRWLQAECLVQFSDNGFFKLKVRALDDGTEFLSYEKKGIDMFRDGNSFVRPKWGIYRSIATKEYILNEEDVVYFANFEIDKLRVRPNTTGIGKAEVPFDLRCYPNPANDFIYCKFKLAQESSCRIILTDAAGRVVSFADFKHCYPGSQELSLPLKGIQHGIYFIRLETDENITVQKIMIQ
ncbi:MAG: T9SS type A sorting domain-containing protein [Bacteroidales bacterium]|nr:T9SS type A sorting domain-containing protein [Bacteroidales bacterium]